MATIGDGFKDIFLAGIGAMAVTAEKGKDLVLSLIHIFQRYVFGNWG